MSINFEKASERLGTLLTDEDIQVIHGNYTTASWSSAERILRLPYFSGNINEDGYLTMLVHEIQHAISTPAEGWKIMCESGQNIRYTNILEDIRIERIAKDTLPGMEGTFARGYYNLYNDCGFFEGIDNDTVSLLSFVDRLNIYSKIGHILDVNFTDDEQDMVDRVYSTKTFEDVCDLVDELLGLQRVYEDQCENTITSFAARDYDDETLQKLKDILGEYISEDGEIDVDGLTKDRTFSTYVCGSEFGLTNADWDDDVEVPSQFKNAGRSKLTAQLIRAANVLMSGNTDLVYRTDHEKIVEADTVVSLAHDVRNQAFPSRRVRSYITDRTGNSASTEAYRTLAAEYSATINKMVAEFNRRKMAIQRLNSTQHKTGKLDVTKLHAVQHRDDLFINQSKQSKGVNHGAVFYIDHSISMDGGRLQAVMLQAFIMTEFCRRVKIPFKTVSWTSGTSYSYNSDGDTVSAGCRTAIVADNKMPAKDLYAALEAMALYISTPNSRTSPFMSFDGTPGLAAKVAMLNDIVEMKTQYNIQKMHAMFLTDGEYWRGKRYTTGASLLYGGRQYKAADSDVDHNMLIDTVINELVESYTGYYVGMGTADHITQKVKYEMYDEFINIPSSVVATMYIGSNSSFVADADKTSAILDELCQNTIKRFA